jgi:hypothetical protein
MAILDIDIHILKQVVSYFSKEKGVKYELTKAIKALEAAMQDIAKIEALMMHIISEVKKADTGKGLESAKKEEVHDV